MLKLVCTLPNLANICLHKSNAELYPFAEGDEDLLEKIGEDVVGCPSIVFTRKAVVDHTFIRKSANMQINYIPTRCVNTYSPVFIRVGISIQKRVDSHLDKTRPSILKIWSCLIFNEQDQKVKLKASLQQADRRKLIASVLMGFVLIATLCLKQWVAFTTSVAVKSCVLLSPKSKFNVGARRESSMH